MLNRALGGLNPEQAQVVAHQDGAMLVPSVAGSGKTHAVTVRMGRMVADGVRPERILAVTFSKKAAEEMTARAQRYANSKQMRVGTFHSVAYEIVRSEGGDFDKWTIDEGNAYRFCIKDAVGFKGMKWKDADISFLEQWIGLAKNELALPGSPKAIEHAKQAFKKFPGKHSNPQLIIEAYERAEDLRKERLLLTFDDMLVDAAVLFQDDSVRQRWASRYDYLIQDEAQDQCFAMMELAEGFARDHRNYMMVGDTNQCLPAGELVWVDEEHARPIEQLAAGDRVLSYRNGANTPQVVKCLVSTGRKACVRIRTAGGRTLGMSLTHKLWATPPTTDGTDTLVYLMYRPDKGFRIGVTNRGYARDGNNYGNRLTSEAAERLWILSRHTSREAALREELRLSLQYGIPTLVFNGTGRGLDQQRIDAIFAEFGHNGARLLEAIGYQFDMPHWTLATRTGAACPRRIVTLSSHGAKGSIVAVEGRLDAEKLRALGHAVTPARRGGVRVRRWFTRHAEAEAYASRLARDADAMLLSRLTHDGDEPLHLINAGALLVGTSVAVRCDDGVDLDEIVDIEPFDADCFDIEVDDANNFYAGTGGGVLTHNCIYSWRGAHPETFLNFERAWDAKVVKMVRNYRSGTTIINSANHVIQSMNPATRVDMTMRAERPHSGEVSALLYTDFDDEADSVARRMLQLNADGVPWSDMVVLYRVNAQSRAPEEALLSKRIPYRILGGTNFYERREVKDLLAYLRAAVGGRLTDVGRCINSPSRFLGKKFLERLEARITAAKLAGGVIDWVKLMTDVSAETGVHAGQREGALAWAKIIHGIRAAIAEGGVEAKPSRLLDKLVMDTKYTQWLVQEEGQESTENNRVANVRELVRAADRFATVEELLKYIDMTIESSKRSATRQPNAVTLMSLHRSKGLEYPTVFLLGCNENVLPHSRGDLDEERRLFYVGLTRAKDQLYVSAVRVAATARGVMDIAPSRFLADAHMDLREPEREVSPMQAVPFDMGEPDDVYDF